MKWSCWLLLAVLAAGCQTSGEKLELNSRSLIKTGMAREEVLDLFGKPFKAMRDSEEKYLDVFRSFHNDPRYSSGRLGVPTTYRVLTVRYGAAGKVEKYQFSEGNIIWNGRSYGLVPGGLIVHALDIKQFKKRETTIHELMIRHGEPSAMSFDFDNRENYHWIFLGVGVETSKELIVTADAQGRVLDFMLHEVFLRR